MLMEKSRNQNIEPTGRHNRRAAAALVVLHNLTDRFRGLPFEAMSDHFYEDEPLPIRQVVTSYEQGMWETGNG